MVPNWLNRAQVGSCRVREAGRAAELTAASPLNVQCDACDAGKVSAAGARVCLACEAGRSQPESGRAACEACAAGRCARSAGQPVCESCRPEGAGRGSAPGGLADIGVGGSGCFVPRRLPLALGVGLLARLVVARLSLIHISEPTTPY